MAYVGFDLDETLGRFVMAEFHTYFLYPHKAIFEGQWSGMYGSRKIVPAAPLTDALREKLETAFDHFAACLAKKERDHLGILRPGIDRIARRLYKLKQEGKVKSVLIYSNNGNLAHLHLAAKMIEKLANTPGLFCNFIHWFHPIRASTGEIRYGQPGAADKKIATLYKAFSECTNEPIDYNEFVKNLYFFDDVYHPDIAKAIGNRYFQNPAYKYDADPKAINDCFEKAFVEAGLDQDPEYYAYIQQLGTRTFEEIMRFIQDDLQRAVRKNMRPNNTNFRRKFNLTFPPSQVNKGKFQKAVQTMRALHKKQNVGSELSNAERNILQNAQNTITDYELQNPEQQGGQRSGKRKTRKQRRN